MNEYVSTLRTDYIIPSSVLSCLCSLLFIVYCSHFSRAHDRSTLYNLLGIGISSDHPEYRSLQTIAWDAKVETFNLSKSAALLTDV